MSTESEFVAVSDRVLQAIAGALDDTDADLDWALNDGVLTIECADGSKLIVNRHAVNRELWVAAKAGGFHFRATDRDWVDTRSGELLPAVLGRLLSAQSGVAMSLPPLPAV